jgi:hypothetical protein
MFFYGVPVVISFVSVFSWSTSPHIVFFRGFFFGAPVLTDAPATKNPDKNDMRTDAPKNNRKKNY